VGPLGHQKKVVVEFFIFEDISTMQAQRGLAVFLYEEFIWDIRKK